LTNHGLVIESKLKVDVDMAPVTGNLAPERFDCLGLPRVEVATWSGKENAAADVHSVLISADFHFDPN
jgi:hypothetical protein